MNKVELVDQITICPVLWNSSVLHVLFGKTIGNPLGPCAVVVICSRVLVSKAMCCRMLVSRALCSCGHVLSYFGITRGINKQEHMPLKDF